MAEITYQMVLSTLQTTGILVGIFYYIMTLQNTRKNQQLTLKAQEQAVTTREAQLFMQIYQQLNTVESQKTWAELLNMKWDNLEDYREKHDSSVNLDSWGKRGHIWWTYTTIGHMLEKDLIDPDLVYRTLGPMVMMQWDKWKDVINDTRERAVLSDARGGLGMFGGFEYLNDEMVKIYNENPDLHPPNR